MYKKIIEDFMKTITEYTVSEVLGKWAKLTGTKMSQSDLARVLEMNRQQLGALKDKPIPKKYNVKIEELLKNQQEDCITIEHIHINPSCGNGTIVLAEADVTPVKIGREIIKNIWNSKPEDLKIFKASGDSMQETITDNDLLLIDLSKTDFRNGGIFLLTINNDWYIKRLRMRLTGELDIISDNPKYPIETLQPDTMAEIKVIGRVIKNLSKGL